MKLLHCLRCGDVVALRRGKLRTCDCGASQGQYVDSVNAEYEGPARVLGLHNHDLARMRGGLPGESAENVRCWVISDHCRPVRKLDKFGDKSVMEPDVMRPPPAPPPKSWPHTFGETMADEAFMTELALMDYWEDFEP